RQRAVHAEIPAESRHGLGGGRGPEEGDRRVSGEDSHHEKHEDQRPEHGREDLREAPGKVPHAPRLPRAGHRSASSTTVPPVATSTGPAYHRRAARTAFAESVPGNRWLSSRRRTPASAAYSPACKALDRYAADRSGTESA